MISILIATYQRARTLSRTLDSFIHLQVPGDADLEMIIVPNGCTDDTIDVIESKKKLMPFSSKCFEHKSANLNMARNRCIQEARGEILAFLDDDILIDPNWLNGLTETYGSTPADLLAGRVRLSWDTGAPPSWSSKRVERLLSQLDFGDHIRELHRPGQIVGANFSFREKVSQRVGGFALGLDRAGQGLLSGGDSEFVRRALASAFKLFYAPKMAVRHCIPAERCTIEYLSSLARSRGLTRVALATTNGHVHGLKLLKAGATHILFGGVQELFFGILRRKKSAVNARLVRMRGLGIIDALFNRQSKQA